MAERSAERLGLFLSSFPPSGVKRVWDSSLAQNDAWSRLASGFENAQGDERAGFEAKPRERGALASPKILAGDFWTFFKATSQAASPHLLVTNFSSCAMLTILALSSLRRLISTPFFSMVFSDTTTRQGMPIKSASANFSPADFSSRSS